MIEGLVDIFTNIISAGSYYGLTFLMILESMVLPVPSEAIMPFAGFLWYSGEMSFWLIVVSSTIGSVIGSLLSYFIGLYGGRPLLIKYGKFILVKEHHLIKTEKFFNRYGDKTIFISRFVPIIRHLISIPAGASRMNLSKFILYTTLGAGLWNTFLACTGYYLGDNWTLIREYGKKLDIIFILIVLVLTIYYFRKKKSKIKKFQEFLKHLCIKK